RNRGRRGLRGADRGVSAAQDGVGPGLDHLRHELGELLIAAVEPSAVDGEVLALDEAMAAKLAEKRGERARRGRPPDGDAVDAVARLPHRSTRRGQRRAREPRDEGAPPYVCGRSRWKRWDTRFRHVTSMASAVFGRGFCCESLCDAGSGLNGSRT